MSVVYKPIKEGEFSLDYRGNTIWDGNTYTRKSRAYKKRAISIETHTSDEWFELVCFFNFICCKCEYEVIGGIPCKDHIIPLFMGGTDSIKNIQPLCRNCNSSKGCDYNDYRFDYCERNGLTLPTKWYI